MEVHNEQKRIYRKNHVAAFFPDRQSGKVHLLPYGRAVHRQGKRSVSYYNTRKQEKAAVSVHSTDSGKVEKMFSKLFSTSDDTKDFRRMQA